MSWLFWLWLGGSLCQGGVMLTLRRAGERVPALAIVLYAIVWPAVHFEALTRKQSEGSP